MELVRGGGARPYWIAREVRSLSSWVCEGPGGRVERKFVKWVWVAGGNRA